MIRSRIGSGRAGPGSRSVPGKARVPDRSTAGSTARLLPLPAPPEMPIPPGLRRKVQALWSLVMDENAPARYSVVARTPAPEWARMRDRLADRVVALASEAQRARDAGRPRARVEALQDESDALLVDLIRQDPRCLATSYVVAKILEWQLAVAYGHRRGSSRARYESGADKRAGDRGRRAAGNLALLARALQNVTGKGNPLWTSWRVLEENYAGNLAAVTEAIKLSKQAKRAGLRPSVADTAEAVGLSPEWVTKVLHRPRQRKLLAQEITAKQYGFSVENLRTMLAKAKRHRSQ
jgi:hypothetical protein